MSDDKHNKRTIAQHNKRKRVMKYEIKPTDRGDYILESVVPTSFGGDAVNYVLRGRLEDCERVRDELIKEGKR